jgi:hypothetical protein
MANVLDEEKREQILALGRLGWSLRRIERDLSVRRETAGAYPRSLVKWKQSWITCARNERGAVRMTSFSS